MNTPRPFLQIPPGEILREELDARGWTQGEFAEIIGRPIQTVNEIIAGKKSITPETALLFSQALGTSAQLWLNLESSYRLNSLPDSTSESSFIERKAKVFSVAPVSELIRLNWITVKNRRGGRFTEKHIDEIEGQLKAFFRVKSLDNITQLQANYRKSSDEVTATSLAAWLQQAQLVAEKQKVKKYNHERLMKGISQFPDCSRSLHFLEEVQERLSDCGVRLVILPHLRKTKLDGAAFWLEGNAPVIGLTLRINRIDNFWFTLMHELAHILYHKNKIKWDEEIIQEKNNKEEKIADKHAQNWLISEKLFSDYIDQFQSKLTVSSVRKFAEAINRHPAIVVGRLQHNKWILYSYMRNVLEKT
ncbi:HigA family addiction module antitoxin, partial [Oligoflexia bacterium]|nr:HigA family addiction module antitoxin [Oligoflexia bacterium]